MFVKLLNFLYFLKENQNELSNIIIPKIQINSLKNKNSQIHKLLFLRKLQLKINKIKQYLFYSIQILNHHHLEVMVYPKNFKIMYLILVTKVIIIIEAKVKKEK